MVQKNNLRGAIGRLKQSGADHADVGRVVLAAAAELFCESDLYRSLPQKAYARKESERIRDGLLEVRRPDGSYVDAVATGYSRDIYEVHFVVDVARLLFSRGRGVGSVADFVGYSFENASQSAPIRAWQRKKKDVTFLEYQSALDSLRKNLEKRMHVKL